MTTKTELLHKLDLIKINKEVMDINQNTITDMNNFTPPYIKLDFDRRKEAIRGLLGDTLQLLDHFKFSIEPQIIQKLTTLRGGELANNDILLGILMIEGILQLPQNSEKQEVLKQRLGGVIVIENSNNIIINSQMDIGGSASIGDTVT